MRREGGLGVSCMATGAADVDNTSSEAENYFMKFSEFLFHPDLQRGIEAIGFQECMPVQKETFEHLKNGLDVYAQSQTGTGKTAAYLIGGFQYLLDHGQPEDKFLVVAPTRELAVQIEQEARIIGQFLPYRTATLLGGVGYTEQKRLLEQGAELLIGTPGRILDLYRSGDLPLGRCKVMVVDEADRMFDMGFIEDLRKIIDAVPPKEQRLMMLFSATLNSRVGNLSWEYMRETGEVIIEPEKVTVEGVSQRLYHLSRDEKVPLLMGLLQRDKPKSALIFVNTKDEAYQLTRRLEHNGLHVKMLMGNIPQRDRLRVFNQLRNGEVNLVVATDVAARGLHIDDLDMVINYDLPDEAENYVHRIGRTARAGKTGRVVSFACETFVRNLAPIERFVGYKLPVEWVDDTLVAEDKSEGLKFARPGRDIADKGRGGHHDRRSGQRNEHRSEGVHGRGPHRGEGRRERSPLAAEGRPAREQRAPAGSHAAGASHPEHRRAPHRRSSAGPGGPRRQEASTAAAAPNHSAAANGMPVSEPRRGAMPPRRSSNGTGAENTRAPERRQGSVPRHPGHTPGQPGRPAGNPQRNNPARQPERARPPLQANNAPEDGRPRRSSPTAAPRQERGRQDQTAARPQTSAARMPRSSSSSPSSAQQSARPQGERARAVSAAVLLEQIKAQKKRNLFTRVLDLFRR